MTKKALWKLWFRLLLSDFPVWHYSDWLLCCVVFCLVGAPCCSDQSDEYLDWLWHSGTYGFRRKFRKYFSN